MQNAVRQLQHCVTERSAIEVVDIFHQEQKKSGTGGYCRTANKRSAVEMAYQRKAETVLQDENCFKVYIVSYFIKPSFILMFYSLIIFIFSIRLIVELQ